MFYGFILLPIAVCNRNGKHAKSLRMPTKIRGKLISKGRLWMRLAMYCAARSLLQRMGMAKSLRLVSGVSTKPG